MGNHTAITTHYNGFKFRSRLEARWAIFFDELQIPYAYEPEGFDLSGVWYLPDFHLTNGLPLHKLELTQQSKIYVEIKHTPNLDDSDRQKVAEFVRQLDYHILLIGGQPDINTTIRFIDHHPKTGWNVTDMRWLEMVDGQIGLVPIDHLNDAELLNRTNTGRLRHALDKARQARFEHGETPTPPSDNQAAAPSSSLNGSRVHSNGKWRAEPKICERCGKEFRPYRPHYTHCTSCYHKFKKSADAQNNHTWTEILVFRPKAAAPTSSQETNTESHSKPAHTQNNRVRRETAVSRPKAAAPTSTQATGTKSHPIVASSKGHTTSSRKRQKPERSLGKRALRFIGINLLLLMLLCGGFLWFLRFIFSNSLFPATTLSGTATPVPALVLPSTNTPVPTVTNSPTTTPTPIPTETAVPTSAFSACNCSANLYDCTDFNTQQDAQACYEACLPTAGDIHFLDGDQDGLACVSLP